MRMPLLIVTGRTGACGNTKRTAAAGGKASSGTIGHEIVAVGTEPVQPDHAGRGPGAGLELDRGQKIGHRVAKPWRKAGILPDRASRPANVSAAGLSNGRKRAYNPRLETAGRHDRPTVVAAPIR